MKIYLIGFFKHELKDIKSILILFTVNNPLAKYIEFF